MSGLPAPGSIPGHATALAERTAGVAGPVAVDVHVAPVDGGFEDLVVEADLGQACHLATVDAARLAHERGVLVERRV